MRTTLTIDEDVAKLLDEEVRRSGVSLKEAVNGALRAGLVKGKKPAAKPFRVEAFPMGLPEGLSYDNVAEVLDALDGHSLRAELLPCTSLQPA